MKNTLLKSTSILGVLVLILSFALSCSSRDEYENYTPFYVGSWSGNYTGADDSGTWTAVTKDDGSFVGQTHSTITDLDQGIIGTIKENGEIDAETVLGVKFIGTFKNNNTASGTWSYGTSSGDWTGTKE